MSRRAGGLPLRAGILGAGLMGRWHAQAIIRAGGQVVGIVDQRPEAARDLAARTGAGAFADFPRMLGALKLDVLHICTPLDSHFEFARRALEAGLHVLVEKPLTPRAAETEILCRLAAERHLRLCPVHQFPFQDGVVRAQQQLAEIGRLLHLEATFCSAGAAGKSPQQMDEVIADIVPHPLALFQALLPDGIDTNGWQVLHPGPGEFRAACEGGGATASILVSLQSRPTACSLRLFGTGGTVYIDLFHGFCFREPPDVSRLRKILHPFDLACRHFAAASLNLAGRAIRGEPAYPGLRRLIRLFYDSIQHGTAAPISSEEIMRTALIRDHLMAQAGLDVHSTKGTS